MAGALPFETVIFLNLLVWVLIFKASETGLGAGEGIDFLLFCLDPKEFSKLHLVLLDQLFSVIKIQSGPIFDVLGPVCVPEGVESLAIARMNWRYGRNHESETVATQ
jgi:hypothetical protein